MQTFLLIKLQSSPQIVEEWHIKNNKPSFFKTTFFTVDP